MPHLGVGNYSGLGSILQKMSLRKWMWATEINICLRIAPLSWKAILLGYS